MAEAFIDEKGKNRQEIEAMEVAEASREQEWSHPSFVADLFMGNLRLNALFPFPEQPKEDKEIGDAFLAKLDLYLKDHLDGDLVDREGQIPDDVMKGLADHGCFGLKIPKEYGGVGLSQMNYLRTLALVAEYCGSTAATLSAHQSIGVPQPLLLFGTDEQKKKFLPRMAAGAVSAFALTEPDVGSDPAQMSTRAELSADGQHYILNGMKLWCTNGAVAEIIVVMAQSAPKMVKGREKKQISAFIVESNTPGFKVIHRCRFMGLNGIQNALIEFKDVKIPKENLIWGEGKGLKLALVTLNAGRLSLPAACLGGGRKALEISRQWGNERSQWGAPVGKHEEGAAKLAFLNSTMFASEAVTWLGGAWVDGKTQDIRMEAAMAKFFSSIQGQRLIDETLQLRGGRGYERADSLRARGEIPAPVERWYRDSRINQIVEGTNEIMCLFLAREALDRHLKIAGDALNPKNSMGKRLGCLVSAVFYYAFWYPKQWLTLGSWFQFWSLGRLGKHMRFVKRNTSKLARTTFHLMLRHGPKLEKKQAQLRRVVEIATDLFAMAATIGYANHRRKQLNGSDALADVFCWEARGRIRERFRKLCCNQDLLNYKVGRDALEGRYRWLEEHR